jgi:hypothetical protein
MVMDHDLTSFEEACTKADAEEARRFEVDEVARLAKLPKLEYDRQREDAAERLGVRVATLDNVVRDKQAAANDDTATLPHWRVEPSPVPVDGAAPTYFAHDRANFTSGVHHGRNSRTARYARNASGLLSHALKSDHAGEGISG